MIKDKSALGILVIEDNSGDFTLIEDYLEEQFAVPTITHVKNYKEAKAVLNNRDINFDVVLLDLSLPDKNGEELISEIIALCPVQPIIVLSGYSDIDFSIRSLSLGVSDYLLKDDINASSLYKSIVYNIERKKTNRELEESEKRYSNLFHLSPQPMWLYDPATYMFVQVNKAAIEHYGYSKEEFLSMSILDIRPAKDRKLVQQLIKEKGDQKGKIFEGRFRHYKKTNEPIEVEIYSTPIYINDHELRSVIAFDVTEKILIEDKITRAIIKTQDDERYEIGSELHDNICQILATSQICLSMMRNSISPDAAEWYKKCEEYITLASKEIRSLSHRLAPAFFDESTLEDAFMILLKSTNISGRYNITLHFDKALNTFPLHRDIKLNLYRILQEQLRNILNYAHATVIEVSMAIENGNLVMSIKDNGIGFDVNTVKKGIGLANIKRRAELFSGKKEIEASPGNGCKVTITIPLQD